MNINLNLKIISHKMIKVTLILIIDNKNQKIQKLIDKMLWTKL